MTHPILYSFRRCPYAIRARIAIALSQTTVELREVVLKDKPQSLIDISHKATVPVLLLESGKVIDESLDIMQWAFALNTPEKLHVPHHQNYNDISLIAENDNKFKNNLDRYKYADHYSEDDPVAYRKQGEFFLQKLETQLTKHNFLMSNELSIVDYAILPFIRQFAHVDKDWFDQSQYKHLHRWLHQLISTHLFTVVMKKYPQWKIKDNANLYPERTLS